jgi:type IX secretion system PorP/SprF family membrane protein
MRLNPKHMKKRLLTLLFFGFSGLVSNAQQQGLFSNYLLNGYIYNPALAGIEDHIDVRTSLRRQWVNMPGPNTMYASINGAINQKDLNKEELGSLPMRGASTIKFKNVAPKKIRHGLGGFFLNDQAGLITRNQFNIGYSIHLPLNQEYYLAFGMGFGANLFSLGNANLRDEGDDAFAGAQNISAFPDLQAGIYLYSDRLQIGLSSTQMIANRFSFAQFNKSLAYNNLTRHFFGTISYALPLDQDFDLLPVGIIRYTENSPLSWEGGLKIRYRNTFWAGGSYRHQSAIIGMVGLSLSKWVDLAYAYDFATNDIQSSSVGSHEVVLGLRLYNKKPNSSLKVW